MASPESRSSAGPIIGLVLLVAVVGGVFAAFQFLSTSDSESENEGQVSQAEPGAPVKVQSPPEIEPEREFTIDPKAGPKKAENPISFTVRCMDKASQGMAGVTVKAIPMAGLLRKDELAQELSTGADGTAKFEGMPYQEYTVMAQPQDSYPLMMMGVGDTDFLPMVFMESLSYGGTVVDAETDQPIEGVFVQVSSNLDNKNMVARALRAQREGQAVEEVEGLERALPTYKYEMRTGADGKIGMPKLPLGYTFSLSLEHASYDLYEDSIDTIENQNDRTPETFPLLKRTEIFGRVLDDETDQPLAGVLVRAGERGIPISFIEKVGGGADIFECETNELGEFRLPNIPRGKVSLLAQHPGYHKFEETIEVTDIEPTEKDLRLYRGAAVAGTVFDDFGNPVQGAGVSWSFPETGIFGHKTSRTTMAATDAEGRFVLEGLPVDRPLNIKVNHADFIASVQKDLIFEAGQAMEDLEITMRRGGAITGKVQTSNRAVLEGAVITATPLNPPGSALTKAMSLDDGSYIIPNTPAAMYKVSCEAPGYCPIDLTNVRETATGVDFTMVEEAIFEGQLVDEYDSSKTIEVFKIRARKSSTPSHIYDLSDTFRDKEGRFKLNGLLPTEWDFEFTAKGYAPKVVRGIGMREGETTTKEIRMNPGITVVGKVASPRDRPATLAIVRFEYKESFVSRDKTYLKLQTKTDENGDYKMENLAPGVYHVWASHPKFAQPQEMEIVLEDGPEEIVDITLQRPAKLRLLVRDEEGNLIPGAKVSLFRGNSPMESTERIVAPGGMVGMKVPNNRKSGFGSFSDADSKGVLNISLDDSGELRWLRKEPGEWTLWIGAQGFYKYVEKLTLIGGEEVLHTAVMERMREGEERQGRRKSKEERRAERQENKEGEGKKGGKKKDGGAGGAGDGR